MFRRGCCLRCPLSFNPQSQIPSPSGPRATALGNPSFEVILQERLEAVGCSGHSLSSLAARARVSSQKRLYFELLCALHGEFLHKDQENMARIK